MPTYSHYFMQLDIGKQPKQETQTPPRQALSDQDDPWCERHGKQTLVSPEALAKGLQRKVFNFENLWAETGERHHGGQLLERH